jgi:hypothetical protein
MGAGLGPAILREELALAHGLLDGGGIHDGNALEIHATAEARRSKPVLGPEAAVEGNVCGRVRDRLPQQIVLQGRQCFDRCAHLGAQAAEE